MSDTNTSAPAKISDTAGTPEAQSLILSGALVFVKISDTAGASTRSRPRRTSGTPPRPKPSDSRQKAPARFPRPRRRRSPPTSRARRLSAPSG